MDFEKNLTKKWMLSTQNYIKDDSISGIGNLHMNADDKKYPLSNLFEREKYFITRFNRGSRLSIDFKKPVLVSFIYFRLDDNTQVIDNDVFIQARLGLVSNQRGHITSLTHLNGNEYQLRCSNVAFLSTIDKKQQDGRQYYKIIIQDMSTYPPAYLYADVVERISDNEIIISGPGDYSGLISNPENGFFSIEPSYQFDGVDTDTSHGLALNTPHRFMSYISIYQQDYQVIMQYGRHVFIHFTPSSAISDEDRATENFEHLEYIVDSIELDFNLSDSIYSFDVNDLAIGTTLGIFTGFNPRVNGSKSSNIMGGGPASPPLPVHSAVDGYNYPAFTAQKNERGDIVGLYSGSKAHSRQVRFDYTTINELDCFMRLINKNPVFGIIDHERKYNQYTSLTAPKFNYKGVRKIDDMPYGQIAMTLSEVL